MGQMKRIWEDSQQEPCTSNTGLYLRKSKTSIKRFLCFVIVGLIILASLLSCGSDKDTDVEFLPHIIKYEQLSGSQIKVPIYFGKFKKSWEFWIEHPAANTIARCEFNKDVLGKWHNKHIVVNRLRWAALDKVMKEALIFHELIHCHKEYKGHDFRDKIEGFIPRLMAPTLPQFWLGDSTDFRDQVRDY